MSENGEVAWVNQGVTNVIGYRADNRPPGGESGIKRYDGMKRWQNADMTEVRRMLLSDPVAFCQSHVSTNSPYMVSCATNEKCGGYADTRNYVYEIQFGGFNMFTMEGSPIIVYADANSIEDANYVLVTPPSTMDEVDAMFDITLDMIKRHKPKDGNWQDIDWARVGGLW